MSSQGMMEDAWMDAIIILMKVLVEWTWKMFVVPIMMMKVTVLLSMRILHVSRPARLVLKLRNQIAL